MGMNTNSIAGKKSKVRKDVYGNKLYQGEYYSLGKDAYEYRYRDDSGKIKTKGAKTLPLLRLIEDKLMDNPSNPGNGDCTVAQLIEIYFNYKGNIGPVTRSGYWNNYKLHVQNSWLGSMKIKNVIKINIVAFYNELIVVNGLKKSTVALINDFINPAFRLAVDCHWIIDNPCRACLRDVKNTEVKKNEVLTLKQQNSLCQFTQMFYPRFYPILKCCLEMGFRISELLGITLNDIDFKKKEIRIDHQLIYKKLYNEDSIQFRIHKPKTKAGNRCVSFNNEVEQILKQQIEFAKYTYDSLGVFSVDGYSYFVFISQSGKPLTPNSINRELDTIVKKYNEFEMGKAQTENREEELLPHLSSHSLRSTCLTRMCESGMSLKTLQYLAGHESVVTTFDLYVQTTSTHINSDMEKYYGYMKKDV